jgi:hypothetical protein
MKNWQTLQAAALGLLIAPAALAQDKPADKPADKAAPAAAAPMEAPKPPEQVAAAAKMMAGTWKCAGTANASPMGPEHKYEATVTWKISADKFWIVGNYAEKKTKEHPMAYKFTEYRTYDSKANKWVASHMGETSGDLMTGSGTGDDKGSDWTFKSATTSMMPGDFHLVSTVKSPKEIEMKGEVVAPDGAKPVFSSTCKK